MKDFFKNIRIISTILFLPIAVIIFSVMFLCKKGAQFQRKQNQKAKQKFYSDNNLSNEDYMRTVAINTICND